MQNLEQWNIEGKYNSSFQWARDSEYKAKKIDTLASC